MNLNPTDYYLISMSIGGVIILASVYLHYRNYINKKQVTSKLVEALKNPNTTIVKGIFNPPKE